MNKRVFIGVLAVSVLLSCLSGCKKKPAEGTSDESTTDLLAATTWMPETTLEMTTLPEITTAEQTTGAGATTVAATTTTAAPTVTATQAPVSQAPATQAPVTAAPTTAAPVTQAPTTQATTTAAPVKADKSAAEIAAALAGEKSLFKETMENSSAARALTLFGIDSASLSDSSYYAASAAVAEEILVVKLAAGGDANTIKKCFYARQTAQKEDYEDYVPSEVPKIIDAVVYQKGDTLVFCVSSNSDAVRNKLNSLLG